MKERLCVWQDSVLALNFRAIISRCMNKNCPLYLEPISADLCEKCAHRKIITDDSTYDSLKLNNFIEGDQQPDEEIEKKLTKPCGKC